MPCPDVGASTDDHADAVITAPRVLPTHEEFPAAAADAANSPF